MFKTMSLKGKLLGICMTLACFSVALGTIGVFALHNVTEKYDRIASINYPNTASLGKMQAEYRSLRIGLITLSMKGLDDEQGAKALERIQKAIDNYTAADKAYNEVQFMPGENELYTSMHENWKEYLALSQKVVAAYKDPAQRDKAGYITLHEGFSIASKYAEKIQKLFDFHQKAVESAKAEAQSIAKFSNILMTCLAVAALVISCLIGIVFSNAIGRILTQLADRLSNGAEEVASAATQVSGASESLSSSANQQAAALQETSSSVEELSATISKNSENAEASLSTSEKSQTVAQKGKEAMDEMIQAIADIQSSTGEMVKQIEASNQEVAEITKVIAEIGSKTKVINDIVFQTKLLSFNASVEAARAGEQGKGFAVVAEEVGNLAQMSGNSAREITALLESSIEKVERIVSDSKSKIEGLVQQGKEKVTHGTEIAKRCGEVLVEIVENTSSVNERISQISGASKEQENGVREISRAMEQLNQVTQQNSVASQQAASASSELSAQAEALRGGVHELESLIRGAGQVTTSRSVQSGKTHRQAQKAHAPGIEASNVVALKPSKAQKYDPAPSMKKAVGAIDLPSESDSRFKDM